MSFARTNTQGMVPTSQIGDGAATPDKVLYGDRVWRVPANAGGDSSGNIDGGQPDSVYGGSIVIEGGTP